MNFKYIFKNIRPFFIPDNSNIFHIYTSLPNTLIYFIKRLELFLLKSRASPYCINKPTLVQLEITRNCNLKCKMCYRETPGFGKTGSMSFSDFKKIIDKLDGITTIFLFGAGEPLLHKDLIKMIEYCSKKKKIPNVSITTNGMLLTPKMADKLRNSGLTEIRLSMESATPKIYESVRKGAKFDVITKNMKYFTAHTKIPLRINAMIFDKDLDSVDNIMDFAHEIKAKEVWFGTVRDLTKDIPTNLKLNIKKKEKIKEKIKQIKEKAKKYNIKTTVTTWVKRFPLCTTPFVAANIDFKGNLNPCCIVPEITTSNMLKTSFSKAWNSKDMIKWRRLILSGNYPKICYERCWDDNPDLFDF